MYANLETKVYEKRFLLLALAGVALSNLVSNYFGQDFAMMVGNYGYIPIAGSLVILSIFTSYKFQTTGKHGIAWVMFAGFSISWFVAEMAWIVYDVYLKVDPYPSLADLFYVAGYPFLCVFMVFYLQPVKKGISKKILISAIFLASTILVSSIYVLFTFESESIEISTILTEQSQDNFWGMVLAFSYTILDVVVLVPALIGLALFFKGQVSMLWSLICLAIISVIIGDTAFILGQMDDSYYAGHPMEILFLWSYVLMAFGVYNHYSLFQGSKNN